MGFEQTCAPVAVGWSAIEQMDRLWLLQAVTHGKEILKRLRQAGGLLPFIQHFPWVVARLCRRNRQARRGDRPSRLLFA